MSAHSDHFKGVRAVFFDMDGTLIDTEHLSEDAVRIILEQFGVSTTGCDLTFCHGKTWDLIALTLLHDYQGINISASRLRQQLIETFDDLYRQNPLTFIDGSLDALKAAAQVVPTAIVTSAHRNAVTHLLHATGIEDVISFYLCDEDVEHSKPNPQGYLKAAAHLGIATPHCLVFEDSRAGLEAAHRANMQTCAVLGKISKPPYPCDDAIRNFRELEVDFWRRISEGA